MVFGVASDEGFESTLLELVEGKLVNGRKVTAIRIERAQDVVNCHTLYLGSGVNGRPQNF